MTAYKRGFLKDKKIAWLKDELLNGLEYDFRRQTTEKSTLFIRLFSSLKKHALYISFYEVLT